MSENEGVTQDEGGGAREGEQGLAAPNAIAFMTEFTENAQIFSGILMPILSGAVNLVISHDQSITNLTELLNNITKQIGSYEGRLKGLEQAADAVIRAAKAARNRGVDKPEWQEPHRMGNEPED